MLLLLLLLLLLFMLSEVTFDSRKSTLKQQKQKKAERLLTFVTTYHPAIKKTKGGPTRGDMLQEHVSAKCSGDKIA